MSSTLSYLGELLFSYTSFMSVSCQLFRPHFDAKRHRKW